MDRRIKRTRNAVFNAVLDLMLEKDTNKITVLELCKKADINKSTFYLHYKSMDDCLHSCFQTIMDEILEFSKCVNYNDIRLNPEKSVAFLLDEVEKKIDYLSKFKSSSNCAFAVKLLKQNLVKYIAENNGFTIENNYYEVSMITFAVSGCIDVVIEPLPLFKKEELSKVICSMLQSHSN
ncbi:MAG: TetR/AcrR family transcriptional regulator [Eubacterium sp.]|nr:TetR/AcrR family transcriptional regulator [Eubacterium sp.]